jgi:Uma2 family endonuclease
MEVLEHDNDLKELHTVTPADWVPGPQQGDWTYEAYAALTEDGECYEIVQGVLVMSPVPRFNHQKIVLALSAHLYQLITLKKRGEVLTGPFDVVLSPQDVLQPDVLVLLDEHRERLHEERIMGAPDLVVEVYSPSSRFYDRVVKHTLYEQAGVPEYWLVDPEKKCIELFVLEYGKYRSLGIFSGDQVLPSRIVPQLPVSVAGFFA